jgi:hypothetical protein
MGVFVVKVVAETGGRDPLGQMNSKRKQAGCTRGANDENSNRL